MGIGDLGKPEMVFVRRFRFTLKGKYLSEMFNKAVEIDYHARKLYVFIIEVYEGPGKNRKDPCPRLG
jgi:hypothetical protein